MIEAARDHSKSWTLSYAWPLYQIQKCKDPENPLHVALVSYSEEQARKNLARIRKAVEGNPWLKRLMPISKSYTWDADKLEFSNNCTLEAFGLGSSIRGGHYHLVVIDDPAKDHWTISLAEQENFLYGVLIPAVRRGGQVIITGNPVGKQDLLSGLENNGEFFCFKYPAWDDKKVPLWPDQYTRDDLEAKQRLIPAHLFAREYLLKRISSNDAIFKTEWIRYYQTQQIAGIPLFKIMTIDPALVASGDAMAAVVTGTDADGRTFVIDRLSFRGELKAGIDALIDLMTETNPDFIGCEEFAFQKIYRTYLEEEIDRRGMPFIVDSVGRDSRKSKAARIAALQPRIRQGRLLFAQDHKPLIDQLLLWDPASKTNDDDEIDALSWQVPLWQKPVDDGAIMHINPLRAPIRKGQTFDEVFEEIRQDNQNRDYITQIFADMH